MATNSNVTAAKAKVGGACFIAPAGTSIPTDATTALTSTYVCLGHISEDGAENANSPSTEKVKNWNGETVLTVNKGREDTWKVTFLESTNADVLKLIYGDANVEVDSTTDDITVSATSDDLDEHVVVFETVLRGGKKQRIVLPCATPSAIGNVVYKANEPTKFEVTFDAAPDANGKTHKKFIER